MKENSISIVLNIAEGTAGYKLFSQFSGSISDPAGTLLHFECSEATDVGPYLSIVLSKHSKCPGMSLRIPHGYILFISDVTLNKRGIGFVPPDGS